MFRWIDIEPVTIAGMTVKMYRDPFVPEVTVTGPANEYNRELDHHAYTHLGSELLMYQILDPNFEQYMEKRGDVSLLKKVEIPSSQDLTASIL